VHTHNTLIGCIHPVAEEHVWFHTAFLSNGIVQCPIYPYHIAGLFSHDISLYPLNVPRFYL
jgi:hypothetical protein